MEPEFIRVQSCPLDMLTGKVNQVTAPSSDLLVLERSKSYVYWTVHHCDS